MSLAAITFDLDDTLLTYRRSSGKLLELSFEQVGCEPFFGVEEYLEIFDEYVEPGDSIEDVRALSFAHLAREHERDPALGRELAAVYSETRDHANVELYPGAERVLDVCAQRYDVGLITNGPRETQSVKLEAVGIADRFDVTVFAADEVAAKPHRAPFDRALGALDVAPGETWHVGNSLEADVRGALAVGIEPIWITHGRTDPAAVDAKRVETIEELLELPPFDHVAAD